MDGLVILGIIFWVFKKISKAKMAHNTKTAWPKNPAPTTKSPGQEIWQQLAGIPGLGGVLPSVTPAPPPVAAWPVHADNAEGSHESAPEAMDYEGRQSLTTTEGEDICDPALGHDRSRTAWIPTETTAAEAAGFRLDFSRDALVQAFVMQEVLRRPQPRQWARK